nr:GNAT family N-acyltransferase [Poseidonocella pacifica]
MTGAGSFETRLARGESDFLAAQRLRYGVFVEELGGNGPHVDHAERFERDEFDAVSEHLILVDKHRDPGELDHVVGVYRLMTERGASAAGRFYCDDEYDLSPLRQSGRRLLELGRSCVHPEYRGGTAVHLLWNALAAYVLAKDIEILFGVASFHGTDIDALRAPLSLLHHRHLAAPELRPRALKSAFRTEDLLSDEEIDRPAAMREVPSLIKAYLRLGGVVGEGAFIDRAFNTTDICLILDTAQMNEVQSKIYTRGVK